MAFGRVHRAALDHADVQVTMQMVSSPDEANHVGLRGSPTILLDGADPFAEPGTPMSWSCRVHHYGDAVPSLDGIARVLIS